jgi:hypothetical protein
MILGMTIEAFTTFHVIISLLALAVGAPFLFSIIAGKAPDIWTPLFLALTLATSVTGVMFPFSGVNPPHIVGLISIFTLSLAVFALYRFQAVGAWRWIYVVSAVLGFYLNVFVAVVQAFQKVEFFFNLAPTGSEPPFLIAQVFVLAVFGWFGFLALKNFRPAAAAAA